MPTSPAAVTTTKADFQNNSQQNGLVNVSTGDVALLNNVNLGVAANVIANVCGGNNSQQAGLINVSLGDVSILNNVNVGVAANVLVNACDLTVAAAVLAVQGVGDTGQTVCTTAAGPVNIIQS
jgi:hypothetical protein